MLRALCAVCASGSAYTQAQMWPDGGRKAFTQRPHSAQFWYDYGTFSASRGQTVIVQQNVSKQKARRTPSVPPPPNREQGYQDVAGARGSLKATTSTSSLLLLLLLLPLKWLHSIPMCVCVCGEVGEQPNKCRKRDILQDPTDQDEHVEWLVGFFFSFILSSFTCFHPGRWLKTGAGAGACLRARHTCAETRGHWQDGIVHRVLQTSAEALWPIGGYFYIQRTPSKKTNLS